MLTHNQYISQFAHFTFQLWTLFARCSLEPFVKIQIPKFPPGLSEMSLPPINPCTEKTSFKIVVSLILGPILILFPILPEKIRTEHRKHLHSVHLDFVTNAQMRILGSVRTNSKAFRTNKHLANISLH